MQHQLHMYDIVLLERQFKLYFIHKHISGENWIDKIYPLEEETVCSMLDKIVVFPPSLHLGTESDYKE